MLIGGGLWTPHFFLFTRREHDDAFLRAIIFLYIAIMFIWDIITRLFLSTTSSRCYNGVLFCDTGANRLHSSGTTASRFSLCDLSGSLMSGWERVTRSYVGSRSVVLYQSMIGWSGGGYAWVYRRSRSTYMPYTDTRSSVYTQSSGYLIRILVS